MNFLYAILAAESSFTVATPVNWKPFLTTLPVWDYWALLCLPLCLGVAVVYKTTKCGTSGEVPKEAAILFIWIVLGLLAAALAVMAVVALN